MESYIGNRCWQAHGFVSVKFGNVIDQKMENKWLLLKIQWDRETITTWEKVVNVSFREINSWKISG